MGSGCLRKVVKGNAQWGRVCAAQFNWVTVCATCGQSDYTTILRCSIFAKKNYVGGGGGMAETLKLGNPTEHSSTNRRSFVMSSV